MAVKLEKKDFERVFKFGVEYFLDPKKATGGRTTFEPRGCGAILDAFSLGKLTEIGVEKHLIKLNNKKEYKLDFFIKKTSEVTEDPDIVKVKENGSKKERDPKLFIEIKHTSKNDHWIGLTLDQFTTMQRNFNPEKIFMIYASIDSDEINENSKTKNLTGMFLKSIENGKNGMFKDFADLNKTKCKVEFIISGTKLKELGFKFQKGMLFYDTDPFTEKSSKYKKDGQLGWGYSGKLFKDHEGEIELKRNDNLEHKDPEEISKVKVKGSFNLLSKKKQKIIQCLTDVIVTNNMFGEFNLAKGKFYDFNLKTKGRNPVLQRDNIFIAKGRMLELIKSRKLEQPNFLLKKIANEI
jgi:hypothetical protein